MKIACIQPKILENRNKCYEHIESLIKLLLNEYKESDIICLPERWVPFYNKIEENIQRERGDDYFFVKNIAKEYSINLISGAIWEKRIFLKKPSITCYFINHEGEEIGRQDKIHLYTLESKYFQRGSKLNLFKIGNYYFAILICFDMAFYETPRLATENGADLLLSPAQISVDGLYNWNIYLQARVLENRIPVVGCNSLGNIGDKLFPGNSKIISFIKGSMTPSKLQIIEAPMNKSCFIFDDLDLDYPKKLREIRLNEKINKDSIKIEKIS